ncbi:zinc-binding protein A33 isoform X2 [Microcaecilia unicolor]|uniref:Zinc-binding protein A33-like isoform X2 n=1 Tax=Microcaecilia unicolor TaxID=1415580 RepID=A0A6P7YMY1_9AMPH|nr:zinc-binding protein A33-like isoform X2 [Microcaecilia unicolor]
MQRHCTDSQTHKDANTYLQKLAQKQICAHALKGRHRLTHTYKHRCRHKHTDKNTHSYSTLSPSKMSDLEDLRQDLLCPICYDILKDPVILDCSHNTCRGCIDRLWEDQAVCSCPLCRREHPERKYTLNNLLGILIQAYLCRVERECQFCPQEEKLVVETPIPLVNRPTQRFLPVEDAAQQYKAQYLTLEKHISSQFTEMHHWLQQKEQGMIKELKREEKKLLEEIKHTQKSLKDEIQATEESVSHLRDRLEELDPTIFLTKIKNFVEKFCAERTLPPIAPLKGLCLGQFMGPIQYAAWKEMKSIIKPALCPVTLDPKTNHPNLILSKNLTSVKMGEPEEVQNSPLRFNKSICVLGSKGFSTGKHYWEVQVKDKTGWDVGLAKESVNRQEIVKVKPRNGYWAIWLRKGHEIRALDSPSIVLALKTKPQKIGVYLDYEGGQVSFYNADDMSHLYTFKDTFTETLYPMLSPGVNKDGTNEESMKLFHLKL